VDVDAIEVLPRRRVRPAPAPRIGAAHRPGADDPADRIVRVGNAAIEGATLALLSRAKRAELEATCGGSSTAASRRIRFFTSSTAASSRR
jgi:uncharacterized 2Fe-2S/4Fe-4S cluster protein (DUF4445 family)